MRLNSTILRTVWAVLLVLHGWQITANAQDSSSIASEPLPNQLSLFADQPLAGSPTSDSFVYDANEPIQLDSTANSRPPSLASRVLKDQLNFYAPESLILLGSGLAAGAIVANSNMDDGLQRHLHSSLHHANSDDWLEALHANKELGDGRFTLPVFAGAWAIGNLLPDSPWADTTSTWGERTLRGFVVGAPPVLLLQTVTGSSRPGESVRGSEWQPLADNNGVSGHAFMGALPFITAAKMTHNIGLKTTFYAASTLAPLSRTSDGAHYPSQVALGWGMAFLAASAVTATEDPHSRIHILPTLSQAGSGMALEYRY